MAALREDTMGREIVGLEGPVPPGATGDHLWAQFCLLLGDAGAEGTAFAHPVGLQGHFSQQLPLPELAPLLLSQLLGLPTLDQLEPPLYLILHAVHHSEHPGPISSTLVHSDPLVGHGLAEAHLATRQSHELALGQALWGDTAKHPGLMAALPGNLLALSSKLPALGGAQLSLDNLAQCLQALHGTHHSLVF